MGLLVIHPGVSTTVQDLGRPGYRAWGVPVGGAFDATSAGITNALPGNSRDCAVLEFSMLGGTYQAHRTLALAIAGAPMATKVCRTDGAERTIFIPSAFVLEEGERLVVGGARRGARTYLAVRGGWQTPTRLGSRSSENRLRADDQLPAQAGWTPTRHLGPQTPVPADDPIRIIPGPDLLISLDPAWSYRVSPASDRMGIRLEGPSWPISTDPERISTPVAPGALQLAGGQPLLLGVACGTMGGYPHVAHVISSDFDRVAQLKAGDRVRFSTIELAEARHLDRAFREERGRWFQRIATAVGDVCGGV